MVEDWFEEGTVIMSRDPLPDKTLEEMWDIVRNSSTTQELVDAYVLVHNKFWWIEDDEYDYDVGTEEHKKACSETDAWKELLYFLKEQVTIYTKEKELFNERQPYAGRAKQMNPIMEKFGYRDGRGWWIKTCEWHKYVVRKQEYML